MSADARPLLAGFDADRPLAWRSGSSLQALETGRALAAARRLASSIGTRQHVIHLCEQLDHFLVGTLAALLAGTTLVLPPTRLPRTLVELRRRYPESVCLTDVASAPDDIAVGAFVDEALCGAVPAVDNWPTVPEMHPAFILFTSGSTGAPREHLKTWGELCDGAHCLMHSIAAPASASAIVSTVPPQHMFGLEATVMLPLLSGTPVIATRLSFAGDLFDVIDLARARCGDGLWLITTPLQMRAFHRDSASLRGLAMIIASTMPLDPALARAVEKDWEVPVHEIYGCTEGGLLAVRRTRSDVAWTPGARLDFAIDANGATTVSNGHLRHPLALSDRLQRLDGGRFALLGRESDLIKVAGKRASLEELNRELMSVSGVEDAAIFLPEDDAVRLAAVVVAPGRTVAELRRALAERVDSAFLPRPLLLVDALPRNAAGKLPLAALRACIEASRLGDAVEPAERVIEGSVSFPSAHPAFPGHFPGAPIVPGALLLGCVEGRLREAGLELASCLYAKFLSPVKPDETVAIHIVVDRSLAAEFKLACANRVVAAGRLRCRAIGRDLR
jgi:acyl-CoA synthetase (AMP-forming)/AMP-acid ligase II/3-hydroxymyristoyl/3-hydroxydecanoyl-(acyl carrier protein) dehydratase